MPTHIKNNGVQHQHHAAFQELVLGLVQLAFQGEQAVDTGLGGQVHDLGDVVLGAVLGGEEHDLQVAGDLCEDVKGEGHHQAADTSAQHHGDTGNVDEVEQIIHDHLGCNAVFRVALVVHDTEYQDADTQDPANDCRNIHN